MIIPLIPQNMQTSLSNGRRHLSAFGIAATIAACMVVACFAWARNIQEERLHSVAPEFCDAKLHGVALIREAFSRPDTLVFLGSSELIPTVPMRGLISFTGTDWLFYVSSGKSRNDCPVGFAKTRWCWRYAAWKRK